VCGRAAARSANRKPTTLALSHRPGRPRIVPQQHPQRHCVGGVQRGRQERERVPPERPRAAPAPPVRHRHARHAHHARRHAGSFAPRGALGQERDGRGVGEEGRRGGEDRVGRDARRGEGRVEGELGGKPEGGDDRGGARGGGFGGRPRGGGARRARARGGAAGALDQGGRLGVDGGGSGLAAGRGRRFGRAAGAGRGTGVGARRARAPKKTSLLSPSTHNDPARPRRHRTTPYAGRKRTKRELAT